MFIPTIAFIIGGMGLGELLLIGMVAVLLFGKRLPDVAKDIGKHYHRFKSGLQELQSEMTKATSDVSRTVNEAKRELLTFEDDDEPTAPQFSAPPSDDA